jgi:hypothetical protein
MAATAKAFSAGDVSARHASVLASLNGGHRSVRLVERYQAFEVACIHAFHIEALKVLGLNCGYVRHRARLSAACGRRLSRGNPSGVQGLRRLGVKLTLGDQQPSLRVGDLALGSTRLLDGGVTAEVARRQPDGTWRWVIDQWNVLDG